jgi:hypothetical protein
METAAVSVAAGTHWTASSASNWITFPYGNSGTGSGALQYQVAPNAPANGVQTGTILINSTAGTATLTVTEAALVNSPPTVTILNPLPNGSLPSQAQQTVSIQITDPNGPAYISSVQAVINSSLTNAYYSCQITYYPLVDDGVYLASGNAITAYALGVAGSAASPHCVLDTLNTTVTYDQTSVTLNLALTLQPSAVGPQNIYVTATDAAAPTGSVNANYASSLASWQGFAELTTSAPAVSMNPAPPPTSAANQVLHFKISDANGYTSMVGATGWLAAGSQTSDSPCYFQLSQPGHLTLYQMTNSVLSPLGSGDIGTTGVIGAAGACSIDLGQSKIYTSTNGQYTMQDPNSSPLPTDLYVDLWTSLPSSVLLTLPLNINLGASDAQNGNGAPAVVGTWTLPPAITSLSPGLGLVGAPVTIYGTNFGATQGSSFVTFGSATVTQLSWSAGSIIATVPSGATTGNVVVTVGGVASNGSPFTVIPPAPTLSATNPISPPKGAQGLPVNVILTGTNFVPGSTSINTGTSGIQASIGTVSATQITATFTIPSAAPLGPVSITVTTQGGDSNPATFTVTLPPPTLSPISPQTGAQNSIVNVTLTGANFVPGDTTINTGASGIVPAIIGTVTPSQITATFTIPSTATLGAIPITVTTSNGVSSPQTFTVTTPVVTFTSLTPSSGSGLTQIFSLAYGDSNGYADVTELDFLVQTSINPASACNLKWIPASNSFYLMNDAGTNWLGPISGQTGNSLPNGQCTLSGGASNSTGSGTSLTVNFGLTFSGTFGGSKNLYVQAVGTGGTVPWQLQGTWNVAANTVSPPVFSPVPGSFSAAQSVTITTSTPGASIRYTTDGSTPSETAGILYSGAISVATTDTLKAIAYESGWTDSAVVPAAYTISSQSSAPTLTPGPGTYSAPQTVTIVAATGTTISYTTDTTTPTETHGTQVSGSAQVLVSASGTIKAIAYGGGYADSAVVSGDYTIEPGTDPPLSKEYVYMGERVIAIENTAQSNTVSAPAFNPPGSTYTAAQTVTVTCPTQGSLVSYTTDQSTPTSTHGTQVSCGTNIAVGTSQTLKAVAYEAGWTTSSVATATFNLVVTAPVFSPPNGGTFTSAQSLQITCPTPNSSIMYTTNSSTPSALNGIPLTCGTTITVNGSETVQAIALVYGWTPSPVVSAAYTIMGTVAPPVFTPNGGTFTQATQLTMTCPTSGASIWYTTNSTIPSSTNGYPLGCGQSITVSSSETVNAVAYETGWVTSTMTSAVFTINTTTSQPPQANPNWSEGAFAGKAVSRFTFSFSDSQGPSNINWVSVDIGPVLSATSSCMAYFYSGGYSVLYADNGAVGPTGHTGQNGVLQNNQCAIDLTMSKLYQKGDGYLYLDLYVMLTPSYAGNQNIWLSVQNMQNQIQAAIPNGWLSVTTGFPSGYPMTSDGSTSILWTNPTSYAGRNLTFWVAATSPGLTSSTYMFEQLATEATYQGAEPNPCSAYVYTDYFHTYPPYVYLLTANPVTGAFTDGGRLGTFPYLSAGTWPASCQMSNVTFQSGGNYAFFGGTLSPGAFYYNSVTYLSPSFINEATSAQAGGSAYIVGSWTIN